MTRPLVVSLYLYIYIVIFVSGHQSLPLYFSFAHGGESLSSGQFLFFGLFFFGSLIEILHCIELECSQTFGINLNPSAMAKNSISIKQIVTLIGSRDGPKTWPFF